jgi:hypothetical protein
MYPTNSGQTAFRYPGHTSDEHKQILRRCRINGPRAQPLRSCTLGPMRSINFNRGRPETSLEGLGAQPPKVKGGSRCSKLAVGRPHTPSSTSLFKHTTCPEDSADPKTSQNKHKTSKTKQNLSKPSQNKHKTYQNQPKAHQNPAKKHRGNTLAACLSWAPSSTASSSPAGESSEGRIATTAKRRFLAALRASMTS